MQTKSSAFALVACGLAVFALASQKHVKNASSPGAPEQTLQASAEVVSTTPRLQIKLSVTNVSGQDKTFWAASGNCTNERWKTDAPHIFIFDYCVSHTKICMSACVHHLTLHPGETFSEIVTPYMGSGTRLGKRILRFANSQPDIALANHAPLIPGHKYKPRVYWTNPITLTIHKEWLQ